MVIVVAPITSTEYGDADHGDDGDGYDRDHAGNANRPSEGAKRNNQSVYCGYKPRFRYEATYLRRAGAVYRTVGPG